MKPAKPMTILLVEDYRDAREAMKAWFEEAGHTVIPARSSESGIALGRAKPFDVLVCDLQLPDGDGTQVMAQLSEEKPVLGISVSGRGAPTDVARSKAAGFLAHLIKPFGVEEMDAALAAARRELDRRAESVSAPKGPRHA